MSDNKINIGAVAGGDNVVDPNEQPQSDFSKNLWNFLPKAVYEFFGIYFFVMIIYFTEGNLSKFILGFWVILTIFGSFSGGHVNPSITMGFYVYDGNWGWGLLKLILYWFAQFLGAGLSAKLSSLVTHKHVFVAVPANTTFEILISEFFFTGTFLFIILFVCSPNTGPTNGLAPTKCAIICSWFYCAVSMGAQTSGAAYNPAILLALNSFEYLAGNANALYYVLGMMGAEICGAIVFAFAFKYLFDFKPESGKK